MKLGKNQIRKLTLPVTVAQIVGDSITRSLVKKGLMKAWDRDGDSCVSVTPEGLEALAAAMRGGRVDNAFDFAKFKQRIDSQKPLSTPPTQTGEK